MSAPKTTAYTPSTVLRELSCGPTALATKCSRRRRWAMGWCTSVPRTATCTRSGYDDARLTRAGNHGSRCNVPGGRFGIFADRPKFTSRVVGDENECSWRFVGAGDLLVVLDARGSCARN